MSKDRARRRAAREAQLEAEAAPRAERRARTARRDAIASRLTAIVRSRRRRSPVGPLAWKRRRAVGLLLLGFVVTQALAWAVTADWGMRVAVAVASLFALPVVAVFVL